MHPTQPQSPEDQEQLLHTIEMFEVIVQASPNDPQSLEVLREAYLRAGRVSEGLQTARKLAELYVAAQQFSAAVLEYEIILQQQPSNLEVIAELGEVEEKMRQAGQTRETVQRPSFEAEPNVAGSGEGVSLMATAHTTQARAGGERVLDVDLAGEVEEDGNEALARFLTQNRLAPDGVVRESLKRVTRENSERAGGALGASLIDEVVRSGALEMDEFLSSIIDRSKFNYIPLEYYEVDRQVVRMLPDSLTLGRLIVPFDIMSRTLMVATVNPFDAFGKRAVEQLLDYNIQWHLAAPAAVFKVLSDTYKVSTVEMPEMIATRVSLPVAPQSELPAEAPASVAGPDTSGFRLASS